MTKMLQLGWITQRTGFDGYLFARTHTLYLWYLMQLIVYYPHQASQMSASTAIYRLRGAPANLPRFGGRLPPPVALKLTPQRSKGSENRNHNHSSKSSTKGPTFNPSHRFKFTGHRLPKRHQILAHITNREEVIEISWRRPVAHRWQPVLEVVVAASVLEALPPGWPRLLSCGIGRWRRGFALERERDGRGKDGRKCL
jgi:hypothetical protein